MVEYLCRLGAPAGSVLVSCHHLFVSCDHIVRVVETQSTDQSEPRRFLVELMRDYETHRDSRANLRPSGKWSPEHGMLPGSVEEWTQLEAYMAFFEQCGTLISDGMLSKSTFRKLFGAPFSNLVSHNEIMMYKLHPRERQHWKLFIKLATNLGLGNAIQNSINNSDAAAKESESDTSPAPFGSQNGNGHLRVFPMEVLEEQRSAVRAYAELLRLREAHYSEYRTRPQRFFSTPALSPTQAELVELFHGEALNTLKAYLENYEGNFAAGDDNGALKSAMSEVKQLLPSYSSLRATWIANQSPERIAALTELIAKETSWLGRSKYRRLVEWSLRVDREGRLEHSFRQLFSDRNFNNIPDWVVTSAQEYFGAKFDGWLEGVSPDRLFRRRLLEADEVRKDRAFNMAERIVTRIEPSIEGQRVYPDTILRLLIHLIQKSYSGGDVERLGATIDDDEFEQIARNARSELARKRSDIAFKARK